MPRNVVIFLAAASALAVLLGARWAGRPAPAEKTATRAMRETGGEKKAVSPVAIGRQNVRRAAPDSHEESGFSPKGEESDESPWAARSEAESDEEAGIPCGGDVRPDLERLRRTIESMESPFARREAFRRMISGDAAAVAGALALYWSSSPSDPWIKDFLAVLRTSAPPRLATWLASSAATAATPDARAQFQTLLGYVQGPAAAESVVSAAMNATDPGVRSDFLALLRKRRAASETEALAAALSVEGNDDVVASAACGLASIGGARACACLAEAAEDTQNSDIILDALIGTSSPFSQEALRTMGLDPARPVAVRVALTRAFAKAPARRSMATLEYLSSTAEEPLVAAVAQVSAQILSQNEGVGRERDDARGSDNRDEQWF